MDMYTLPCLKWITDRVWHRELHSMLCSGLDGRGVCGEIMVTHVCMWGAFAVHLKLSQYCLLIVYTPIQNSKKKIKRSFVQKEKKITITEGPQAVPAFQPITNCTALA